MNALFQMRIEQSARCKKPLTVQKAAELRSERSRIQAELDCQRGLEPQETNAIYLRSYGLMYERLEKCTYLERVNEHVII